MNRSSLFNLAGPDLFFILIIVLLLFGAKKLPDLFRGLGQAFREFRKAKDEFEQALTGLDGPSEDGQRSDITNRVLVILVVLAGVISIAFALES